jgi:hypothetical protein
MVGIGSYLKEGVERFEADCLRDILGRLERVSALSRVIVFDFRLHVYGILFGGWLSIHFSFTNVGAMQMRWSSWGARNFKKSGS